MGVTLSRLTVLAVCIWLGLLFYISTMLVRVQKNTRQYSALSRTSFFTQQQNVDAGKIGNDGIAGGAERGNIGNLQEVLNRIQKARSEMNGLKQQNDQLKQMLYQSSTNVLFQNNPESLLLQSSNLFLPNRAHQSANHESLRRSIETNVMELWYRTHEDLERLRKSKSSSLSIESLDKLKFDRHPKFSESFIVFANLILKLHWSSFTDQWRVLLSQVSQLADIDGASEWRERQLRNLTAVIQTKLDRLQNPSDCARYLMRYSNDMKKELEATEVAMNFRNPIVGIHVRRTDKLGSEAQFHSLGEYMEWAEHYVRLLDMKRRRLGEKLENDKDRHNNRQETAEMMNKSVPKRIFLATDDPSLLADAKSTYTDWEFMGSSDVASSAQLSSRYTDSSLHGLLKDIHFLSKSDYLVCTFSSQVCRVAYELQQVSRGDWANRVHSLDDLFYFGGQLGHEVTAIIAHQPPPAKNGLGWSRNDQIELTVGDTIGIAGWLIR